MDKPLVPCSWEEIHGFSSPGEYKRLNRYIESQVASGVAYEVAGDENYSAGEICGGRWFQDSGPGQTWRLVVPDLPFRGRWEPVKLNRV